MSDAPAVWSSTTLLEFDFAGIEAVLLGWFMRRPEYLRLAKLGMHAYLASHVLKRPADLAWPDADLARYFKEIKGSDDPHISTTYNGCKRVVHGNGYGQTPMGTYLANPKLFSSLSAAQKICDTYYAIAPGLPAFHRAVRRTAYDQHYLGGPQSYTFDEARGVVEGHPYQYKLWFWSVIHYERLKESQRLWRLKRGMPVEEINGIWYGIQLGEDAKKVVAYYPQSTARGVLTEACLPLFDPEEELAERCYIGDLYYGETPLRAPIHDSLLVEVPTRKADRLIERVAYAMQRPVEALPCPPAWGIGEYLSIGVDAKRGPNWGSMSKIQLPTWQELGVSTDTLATPAEDEDVEDLADMEMSIGA